MLFGAGVGVKHVNEVDTLGPKFSRFYAKQYNSPTSDLM